MSIHTENKRRSVLHILPTPSGTVSNTDRRVVLWQVYSGLMDLPVIAMLGVFGMESSYQVNQAHMEFTYSQNVIGQKSTHQVDQAQLQFSFSQDIIGQEPTHQVDQCWSKE